MAFKRVKDPTTNDGTNRGIEEQKQRKVFRNMPMRHQGKPRTSFFYYNGGEPRKVDGAYANNTYAQLGLRNAAKRSKEFRTKIRFAA